MKLTKKAPMLFAVLAVLGLSGCGTSRVDNTKLVIGMECGYQPFNWTVNKANDYTLPIHGTNQFADGYDIAVARYLSQDLGKEVVIKKIEWDSLIPSLLNDEINMVLAGMSVGFGGLVFLSAENRVIGAALFTVGLFCICIFGFHLFTGKVCYVFQNDRAYALDLPLIWLGNAAGTGVMALLAFLTRNAASLQERAAALCQVKLNDSLLSLFFLGLLCNMFIYIAVEGYRNNPHELGKYLSLFFGVMGFILAGTEHCVADLFYFWMAGAWSGRAILCILTISLGNAVGGVLLPLLRSAVSKTAA